MIRDFKKNFNVLTKVFLFCAFLVVLIYSVKEVKAVSYYNDDAKTHVCFNSSGAYKGSFAGYGYLSNCPSGSSGYDAIKMIDGKYAFCVNWERKITYNGDWQKVSDWNTKNIKHSIISGFIMDDINSRGLSTAEAYTLKAAALNTYFAKYVSAYSAGSKNFYGSNSTIKGIIDSAVNKYNNTYNTSKTLPSATFAVSGNLLLMNQLNGSATDFISGKITVSNLTASYGGKAVKHVLSGTTTVAAIEQAGSVVICTDPNGKNCASSVDLTGKSSYSFYVKATGVKDNSLISIKVDSSNSSSYPTTVLYYNTVYTNYQRLLISGDNINVNRTKTTSQLLIVPDLQSYRISIYKVDENNFGLNDVKMELYKDDATKSSNKLADNTNWSISYVLDNENVSETDFFNHDYILVEKKAPDGYILSSTPIKIYSAGDTKKNSAVCYNNDGKEVSYDYCESYQYKCKGSSAVSDLDESGNCAEETVKACYNVAGEEVNDEFCSTQGNYTSVVTLSNTIFVAHRNKKNLVNISKMDATGTKEIEGAELKICTDADYKSNGVDCTAAKTVDEITMSWVSDTTAQSFSGIKRGNYVIVEVTPPSGYVKATTVTEFSIDEYGKVKTGDSTIDYDGFKNGETIVINNELNNFTISKQDIATSKELPGATISICATYKDDKGNIDTIKDQYTGECVEAVLADGTEAKWVSTDKPKTIKGLPVGTYALVEKIAPKGYEIAESIIFTMNEDGSLTDVNGKSLNGNKLVMKDKKITEVKTGSLPIYIVIGTIVVVVALAVGSYYYMKNKSVVPTEQSNKIRKRRIHKK